jgi:hypothetical protein
VRPWGLGSAMAFAWGGCRPAADGRGTGERRALLTSAPSPKQKRAPSQQRLRRGRRRRRRGGPRRDQRQPRQRRRRQRRQRGADPGRRRLGWEHLEQATHSPMMRGSGRLRLCWSPAATEVAWTMLFGGQCTRCRCHQSKACHVWLGSTRSRACCSGGHLCGMSAGIVASFPGKQGVNRRLSDGQRRSRGTAA